MSDCDHAIQPFDKCYLRDEWTNPLTCPYCDLQRHKDALGRIGEQVVDMKSYGPPYALAGDNIANMFDSDGNYIWPIEGEEYA